MKLRVVRTTSRDSHVSVNDHIFGSLNPKLLAQAIRVYLSNKRQGTSQTQNRSRVNRTTRKWYRQKGTGNARHGARDANIFVGGAVAHGPTGEENWKLSLNKSLKKQATVAALSAQVDNIVLNDEIDELEGKTKEAYQLLNDISLKYDEEDLVFDNTKFLIIADERQPLVTRALRNLPNVRFYRADQINALLIATADKIVMTQKAMEVIEEKLGA